MRDPLDYIINRLLPEVHGKMVEDNKQYGDHHQDLGLKGQFSDIYRKITPLKRALWEDEELPNEQPREILFDLIGHCLLTIELIDRGTGSPE
jgi:hypothetical protein